MSRTDPTSLGTPTRAPTIAVGGSAIVVSETRLNLRVAPATSAAIVAKLSPGVSVTVIDRDETGTWVQVETAEGVGLGRRRIPGGRRPRELIRASSVGLSGAG